MRQPGKINRRFPCSKVWIERYTSEVLAVDDPRRFNRRGNLFNLMWPLHAGEIFGLLSHILWCPTGFGLLILYITGIIL